MKKCVFNINTLTGEISAANVLDAANRLNGIKDAKVDLWSQRAAIVYDESKVDINSISSAIENQGYKVEFN